MAGLIRNDHATARAAFSFADLEGQAATIVREARAQAERILSDARSSADKLSRQTAHEAAERGAAEARRAALEQLRRESFDQMLAESRQHLSDLSASLATSLDRFERAKSGLLAAAERRVIELAIAIARRVCKIDVGRDSAAVVANARALLEMAQHEHDLKLLVSVADHSLMQQLLPDLLATTDQQRHVAIIADPNVQRGDCVLVGSSGTIDAGITTQLDRVATALCDGVPSDLAAGPADLGAAPDMTAPPSDSAKGNG